MVSVSIFSGSTIPEIAQVTDGCGVFPAMFTSFLEKKTKKRTSACFLLEKALAKETAAVRLGQNKLSENLKSEL